MKKPWTTLLMLIAIAVGMVVLIIIFAVVNPANKAATELLPAIIICSLIFVSCIALIVFFFTKYRKVKPAPKAKLLGTPKINFYTFNKKIGVVEVFAGKSKVSVLKTRLDEFLIENKMLPQANWQAMYMEQYFSEDRTKKLCETYDEPADDTQNFILTFFIYELTAGQTLCTPFGKVTVTELLPLPTEYKKLLKFHRMD